MIRKETWLTLGTILYSSVLKPQIKTTEDFMTLVYTPRAVFKVKAITRSNAAIAGHGSTILCCLFAPNDSGRMCSGAGDSTARIWDCNTHKSQLIHCRDILTGYCVFHTLHVVL